MDPIITEWRNLYETRNHPTLLGIHILGVEETDSMIPRGKIQTILDKPSQNLLFHPRLKSKKPIDEGEVWFILDCISSALAFK